MSALLARLHALVTEREDARPAAAVRIVVGLAALVRVIDGSRILNRLLEPTTIRLPYAGWAPEPTPTLVAALLIVWAASAACVTVGWWTRTAAAVLVGVLAVVVSLDQQTYSNHLYLLALVVALLALANAGGALSVDARGRRGPRPTVPAWPLALLKAQVSIVYGFAALAKMNPEYATGVTLGYFVPMDAGMRLLGVTTMVTLVALASLGSIAVELLLAVWLWVPARRRTAFALGIALHLGMIASMTGGVRLQLVIFAVEMWALYLHFATPAELAAVVRVATRLMPRRVRVPARRAFAPRAASTLAAH